MSLSFIENKIYCKIFGQQPLHPYRFRNLIEIDPEGISFPENQVAYSVSSQVMNEVCYQVNRQLWDVKSSLIDLFDRSWHDNRFTKIY